MAIVIDKTQDNPEESQEQSTPEVLLSKEHWDLTPTAPPAPESPDRQNAARELAASNWLDRDKARTLREFSEKTGVPSVELEDRDARELDHYHTRLLTNTLGPGVSKFFSTPSNAQAFGDSETIIAATQLEKASVPPSQRRAAVISKGPTDFSLSEWFDEIPGAWAKGRNMNESADFGNRAIRGPSGGPEPTVSENLLALFRTPSSAPYTDEEIQRAEELRSGFTASPFEVHTPGGGTLEAITQLPRLLEMAEGAGAWALTSYMLGYGATVAAGSPFVAASGPAAPLTAVPLHTAAHAAGSSLAVATGASSVAYQSVVFERGMAMADYMTMTFDAKDENGNIVQQRIPRDIAAINATIYGMVAGGADLVPFGVFGKGLKLAVGQGKKALFNHVNNQILTRPKFRNMLATLFGTWVGTTVSESLMEGAQGFSQNVLGQRALNQARSRAGVPARRGDLDEALEAGLQEGLAGASATFYGLGFLSFGLGSVGTGYGHWKNYQESKKAQDWFEELSTEVGANKVIKSYPAGAGRELLQSIVDSNDGVFKELFIEVEDVLKALDAANVSMETLEAELPFLARALSEAGEGESASVSLVDYGTMIKDTVVEPIIRPHIKLSPEQFTSNQMERARQEQAVLVDEEAETVFRSATNRQALESQRDAIREILKAKLLEAHPNITNEEAEAQAALVAQMQVVIAGRAGKMPAEVFAQRETVILGQGVLPRDADGVTYAQNGEVVQDQLFNDFFKDSAVRSSDGRLLLVSHGTSAVSLGTPEENASLTAEGDIEFFMPLSHFGTPDAARDRLVALRSGREMMQTSDPEASEFSDAERLYPVYLNITNPLVMEDIGAWHMLSAWEHIAEWNVIRSENAYGFTEEESNELKKIFDDWKGAEEQTELPGRETEREYFKRMVDALEGMGYDGIRYENVQEDAGSDSFIIFHPEQAKAVWNKQPTTNMDPLRQPIIPTIQVTDKIDSPQFRRWFRSSYVTNPDGSPRIVYHGTTRDFEEFNYQYSNIESHLGGAFYFTTNPSDANTNYAGFGPDLVMRAEILVEQIVQEMIDTSPDMTVEEAEQRAQLLAYRELGVEHRGAVMPVYLSVQNPLILTPTSDQTVLISQWEMDDDVFQEAYERAKTELTEEGGYTEAEIDRLANEQAEADVFDSGNIREIGTLAEFIEAMEQSAANFVDADTMIRGRIGYDNDMVPAVNLIDELKSLDGLAYAQDPDTGKFAVAEIIRQAVEAAGYDGIVMDPTREFPQMKDLYDPDTGEGATHIIVFRPEQIKSVFNRGEFSLDDARVLEQPSVQGAAALTPPVQTTGIKILEGTINPQEFPAEKQAELRENRLALWKKLLSLPLELKQKYHVTQLSAFSNTAREELLEEISTAARTVAPEVEAANTTDGKLTIKKAELRRLISRRVESDLGLGEGVLDAKQVPKKRPLESMIVERVDEQLGPELAQLLSHHLAAQFHRMPLREKTRDTKGGSFTAKEAGLQTATNRVLNNRSVQEIADFIEAEHEGGRIEHTDSTPAQEARLEERLYSEAVYALQLNPDAIGWYRENLDLAMRILDELPYANFKNPEDRFVMQVLLTISSNGNDSGHQFNMAFKEYMDWKTTGRFTGAHIWGDKVSIIRKQMELVQALIDEHGWETISEFLTRKGTPATLRTALVDELGFTQKQAEKLTSEELIDESIPFSIILGPKLGSFFNNLNGDYSTTTFDVWFMRWFGRNAGTYQAQFDPEAGAKRIERVRKAVGFLPANSAEKFQLDRAGLALTDEDAVVESLRSVSRYFAEEQNREGLTASEEEFRKAVNGVFATRRQDTPKSGGHRSWMRRRMEAVRQRLAQDGIDINPADLQAVLWYLEKEIYYAFGQRKKSDSDDYASAAESVYAELAGRPSAAFAEGTGRVEQVGRAQGRRRIHPDDKAAQGDLRGRLVSEFKDARTFSQPSIPDSPEVTSIELFAGVGVLSQSGQTEPLQVWEMEPGAQRILRGTLPNADVRGDILGAAVEDFEPSDIIYAGLECKDFSRAQGQKLGIKARRAKEQMDKLAAVVETNKPNAVVIENVGGIADRNSLQYLANTFGRLGYGINLSRHNSRNWTGANRERVFILLYRNDLGNAADYANFDWPEDPIAPLVHFGRDVMQDPDTVPEDFYLSEESIRNKQKETFSKFGKTTLNAESGISPAITASYAKHTEQILVDDGRGIRPLTRLEMGRLQGWPVDLIDQLPQHMGDRSATSGAGYARLTGNSITYPIAQAINSKLVPIVAASKGIDSGPARTLYQPEKINHRTMGGVLYSKLAKILSESKDRKMTVPQAKKLLQKAKDAEVFWSGAQEYIDALPDGAQVNLDDMLADLALVEVLEMTQTSSGGRVNAIRREGLPPRSGAAPHTRYMERQALLDLYGHLYDKNQNRLAWPKGSVAPDSFSKRITEVQRVRNLTTEQLRSELYELGATEESVQSAVDSFHTGQTKYESWASPSRTEGIMEREEYYETQLVLPNHFSKGGPLFLGNPDVPSDVSQFIGFQAWYEKMLETGDSPLDFMAGGRRSSGPKGGERAQVAIATFLNLLINAHPTIANRFTDTVSYEAPRVLGPQDYYPFGQGLDSRPEMADLFSAKWDDIISRGVPFRALQRDDYHFLFVSWGLLYRGTSPRMKEVGHFDIPRHIVHARWQRRVHEASGLVMLIDEIQSDMEKRGKEQGWYSDQVRDFQLRLRWFYENATQSMIDKANTQTDTLPPISRGWPDKETFETALSRVVRDPSSVITGESFGLPSQKFQDPLSTVLSAWDPLTVPFDEVKQNPFGFRLSSEVWENRRLLLEANIEEIKSPAILAELENLRTILNLDDLSYPMGARPRMFDSLSNIVRELSPIRITPDYPSGFIHDLAPDHPFRGKTVELAMKKLIAQAAEEGYEKVVWTPGFAQVGRYEDHLRQQVDRVTWSDVGNDTEDYLEWEEDRIIAVARYAAENLVDNEDLGIDIEDGDLELRPAGSNLWGKLPDIFFEDAVEDFMPAAEIWGRMDDEYEFTKDDIARLPEHQALGGGVRVPGNILYFKVLVEPFVDTRHYGAKNKDSTRRAHLSALLRSYNARHGEEMGVGVVLKPGMRVSDVKADALDKAEGRFRRTQHADLLETLGDFNSVHGRSDGLIQSWQKVHEGIEFPRATQWSVGHPPPWDFSESRLLNPEYDSQGTSERTRGTPESVSDKVVLLAPGYRAGDGNYGVITQDRLDDMSGKLKEAFDKSFERMDPVEFFIREYSKQMNESEGGRLYITDADSDVYSPRDVLMYEYYNNPHYPNIDASGTAHETVRRPDGSMGRGEVESVVARLNNTPLTTQRAPEPFTQFGIFRGALPPGKVVSYRKQEMGEDEGVVAEVTIDDSGRINEGPDEWIGMNIRDVSGSAVAESVLGSDFGALEGDQITIGGKGYEDVYDKKLVQVANAIGKRFGAKVSLNSEPVGGEMYHSFPITDELRRSLTEDGLPLFQPQAEGGGPDAGQRASVTLGDTQNVIQLTKSSDVSSFLHESAHIFLDQLQRLAEDPNATDDILDMWARTQSFLGHESGVITRDQHERFARSFEHYLFDGVAPSVETQGLFLAFSVWFKNLYKSLKEIYQDTPVSATKSAEIRYVFDRMVATDQQIAAAIAEVETGVIPALAEGMTPAQLRKYLADEEAAVVEATTKTLAKVFSALKRRYGAEAEEERAAIRSEVEDELNANPDYRLDYWLRNGLWPGEDGPEVEHAKLSYKILRADPRYGAEVIDALGRGRKGVVANNGIDPDELANRLELNSGDELIQTLLALPDREETIQGEIEKRMAERHPDLVDTGRILDEARAQVAMSTKLQQRIERDIERLTDKAAIEKIARRMLIEEGGKPEEEYLAELEEAKGMPLDTANEARNARVAARLAKARKEAAKTHRAAQKSAVASTRKMKVRLSDIREEVRVEVEAMSFRELTPDKYRVETLRKAREVEKLIAARDYDGALKAKIAQLRALEKYRQVREARLEIRDIREYQKKFDKVATRDRIAKAGPQTVTDSTGQEMPGKGIFWERIVAAREKFSFKNVSLQEQERLLALSDFKVSVEESHEILVLPQSLENRLSEANRINWKDAPLTDLRDFRDYLKNLETLARRWNEIRVGKEKRDLNTAIVQIVNQLQSTRKPKGHTPIEESEENLVRRGFSNVHAAMYKLEALFEELDGDEHGGVMYAYFMQPFNDAQRQSDILMQKLSDSLNGLLELIPKQDRKNYGKLRWIPEFQENLSRETLLTVALNWGNVGQREKMLAGTVKPDGSHWTFEDVSSVLNRELGKQDWDFVQGVWDMLNRELWPDIRALHKRVTGLNLEGVKAAKVVTPHGEYAGGYYPIVYDPRRSITGHGQKTAEKIEKSPLKASVQNVLTPYTRHGHDQARVDGVKLPMLFDFSALTTHINEVVHDLSHREAVASVHKLLDNNQIGDAMGRYLGVAQTRIIKKWVEDIATRGSAAPAGLGDGLAKRLRMNQTVVTMGVKYTVMMAQILGLADSAHELRGWMTSGLWTFYGSASHNGDPAYLVGNMLKQAEWVKSVSPFMAKRGTNYDRDVHNLANKQTFRGGWAIEIQNSYFKFIGLMDMAVSYPTWLGAYNQAMSGEMENIDKADHDAAVDYADRTVRLTQGAGDIKDLAHVQRGNELFKHFTMFFGYFSVRYARYHKSYNKEGIAGLAAYAVLCMISDALGEIMVGRGPDWDDEENGFLAWRWFVKKGTLGLFSPVPFARDVGPAALTPVLNDVVGGEKLPEWDFSGSPALQGVNWVVRVPETLVSLSTHALKGEVPNEKEAKKYVKTAMFSIAYGAPFVHPILPRAAAAMQFPARQAWTTVEGLWDWLAGHEDAGAMDILRPNPKKKR